MNNADFRTWLEYHCRAFPGVGEWLSKHQETVEFWEKPFHGVLLSAAKTATDAMVAGQLEEPRGYSKHPQAIATYAQGHQRAVANRAVGPDGCQTYACGTCCDDGLVSVVDPRYWRRGKFVTCAAYCTCPMGDLRQNRVLSDGTKAKTRPRYDPAFMFKVDNSKDEKTNRAEFEEWIETRYQRTDPIQQEAF